MRGDLSLQIQITPPQISEETMKEMAKFFAKTSIPRIMEQMKNEVEKAN